jgi:uncharacterized protein (TIGR02246 family)
MAGKEAIEKLVRDIYAARARGDYDAMAALCAPDASLRIIGADGDAVAGLTSGRSALRERFATLAQFAFANQEMVSILVEGDRAAVHWRADVTFTPTGKSATTEFCDLWTIENGQMTSLIQFIDTDLAGEMTR